MRSGTSEEVKCDGKCSTCSEKQNKACDANDAEMEKELKRILDGDQS